MRNERRNLAWYYGEEIGGRLWRALVTQLANRKTQLGVDEDTLALEDVQVWAELGAPEVLSVLDLALSAQDAALRVRARVDLTSASFPVQVEVVARAEDAKEMQDYAAYFCEKGLVRLSAGLDAGRAKRKRDVFDSSGRSGATFDGGCGFCARCAGLSLCGGSFCAGRSALCWPRPLRRMAPD